jgi:hypothetical protein
MGAGTRGKAPQRRPSLTNRQPALTTTAPKRAKTATAKHRRRLAKGAPHDLVERDDYFGKRGQSGRVDTRADSAVPPQSGARRKRAP